MTDIADPKQTDPRHGGALHGDLVADISTATVRSRGRDIAGGSRLEIAADGVYNIYLRIFTPSARRRWITRLDRGGVALLVGALDSALAAAPAPTPSRPRVAP